MPGGVITREGVYGRRSSIGGFGGSQHEQPRLPGRPEAWEGGLWPRLCGRPVGTGGGRVSQLRVRRRGPYRRLARLEALHVRAAHLVVVALPLPLELVRVLGVRVTQLARYLGEG